MPEIKVLTKKEVLQALLADAKSANHNIYYGCASPGARDGDICLTPIATMPLHLLENDGEDNVRSSIFFLYINNK